MPRIAVILASFSLLLGLIGSSAAIVPETKGGPCSIVQLYRIVDSVACGKCMNCEGNVTEYFDKYGCMSLNMDVPCAVTQASPKGYLIYQIIPPKAVGTVFVGDCFKAVSVFERLFSTTCSSWDCIDNMAMRVEVWGGLSCWGGDRR